MKHLISQIFPDRLISLAAGQSPMKVGWQKFWHIDKGAFVGRFAEVFPFGGIMIGSGSHIPSSSRIISMDHCFSLGHRNVTFGDVIIGSDVRVNQNTTIYPGSVIPDGAVVSNTNAITFVQREENWAGIKLKDSQLSPIFTLSTGRAGSTSIAAALQTVNGIQSKHESVKALTLSGYMQHHRPQLFAKHKNSFINRLRFASTIAGSEIWAESDQRLYNQIPILLEAFPRSKFIHILRDQDNWMTSAQKRGWYAEENTLNRIWERFRPHPKRDHADFSVWEKMSQAEKLQWYYNTVNDKITTDLKRVGKDQCLAVKLEDAHIAQKVGNFVGHCIDFPKLN